MSTALAEPKRAAFRPGAEHLIADAAAAAREAAQVELAEAAQAVRVADLATVLDEAVNGFAPVRIWTGGPGSPQETLTMPGTSVNHIRPRGDGSYLLTSPEQVEVAKKAFGRRFWPDDMPEDMESDRCTTCNWTTRSMRALSWHFTNAHGKSQGTGSS